MTEKSFFGKLIAAIGSFLKHLLTGAENGFKDLPEDQQQQILNGVNISQILKDGWSYGEEYVIGIIATKLNLSSDVAKGVVLYALKSVRINETDVETGLVKFGDLIQSDLTTEGYNGIFQLVAQSAAFFLGTGKINWITLALGVIEYAYQLLKGENKLISLDSVIGTIDTPTCSKGYHWDSEAGKCVQDVPGTTNPTPAP